MLVGAEAGCSSISMARAACRGERRAEAASLTAAHRQDITGREIHVCLYCVRTSFDRFRNSVECTQCDGPCEDDVKLCVGWGRVGYMYGGSAAHMMEASDPNHSVCGSAQGAT